MRAARGGDGGARAARRARGRRGANARGGGGGGGGGGGEGAASPAWGPEPHAANDGHEDGGYVAYVGAIGRAVAVAGEWAGRASEAAGA